MSPFTGKDWINETDHAGPPASPPGTPFSAAAMEDLETRVTDYTDSRLPFTDVTDYGAVGDGNISGANWTGTDNTSAIQAAIDAVMDRTPNPGGTIYFPPGIYKIDGQLDVRGGSGIRFLGAGSSTWIGEIGTWGPTALIFTSNPAPGGQSSRLIDCRNTFSVYWEYMTIVYTHPSYTGLVLDFQHDWATDSADARIRNCLIGGWTGGGTTPPGSYGSQGLINFRAAIICSVTNCVLDNAEIGITGKYNVGESVDYSNVVEIRDNTFNGVKYAITNPGEQWIVEGNCFEGLQGGRPDGQYCTVAYGDRLTITVGHNPGGIFRGNWCGDAFGLQEWVHWGNGSMSGVIESNALSGGVGGVYNPGPYTFSYPVIRNNGIYVGSKPEVQEVSIDATGGHFHLTHDAQETGEIAYDASAATVEAALEALSAVGDIYVTGTAGGPWRVEWWDHINEDVPLLTGDGSALTGGSTTVTVTVYWEYKRSYGIDFYGESGGYGHYFGAVYHNGLSATNGDPFKRAETQQGISVWGNNGAYDQFTIKGHLDIERGPGPTMVAQTAAGSGANTVNTLNSDGAGQFILNTGSGTSAGKLMIATFGESYRSNFPGNDDRTIVQLTPSGSAPSGGFTAPGFFVRGYAATWELWCTNAPTETVSYQFDYFVVQA